MRRYTWTVLLAGLAVLTGCGSSRGGYGHPYPGRGPMGDVIVVDKDGRVVDRDGRVVEGKKAKGNKGNKGNKGKGNKGKGKKKGHGARAFGVPAADSPVAQGTLGI